MNKKIALINFSGNVGKTTVATHLLHPRMDGAQIFSIESINVDSRADGVESERIKGKHFSDLIERLMLCDSAIVDVGASNVEDFLKLMQQYAGSHEEFDFFVVPVVKEKKQQADTVNTLRALAALGISKKKIRLLFNKVELDDAIEREFAALFGLAELEKSFTLDVAAVVHNNEIFDKLKTVGKSLGEVLADKHDYREQLRSAQSDEEKALCVRMIGVKRLATTANQNLDTAYKALFK